MLFFVSNNPVRINGVEYPTYKDLRSLADGNSDILKAKSTQALAPYTPCATATVDTLIKGSDGVERWCAVFEKLPVGSYIFKEVQAPTGYNVNWEWAVLDHIGYDWSGNSTAYEYDHTQASKDADPINATSALYEEMAFSGVEIEKWNKDLQRNAEEGDADRDLIPVKLEAISDEVVVNVPTNGEGEKRKYKAGQTIISDIKVHKKADGKYVWSTDTNENGIWDKGQEYGLSVGTYRIVEMYDQEHESYLIDDITNHDNQ